MISQKEETPNWKSAAPPVFEAQGRGALKWLLMVLGLWFVLILAGMTVYQGEYRSLKFWVAATPLVFFAGIWLFSLFLRARWSRRTE